MIIVLYSASSIFNRNKLQVKFLKKGWFFFQSANLNCVGFAVSPISYKFFLLRFRRLYGYFDELFSRDCCSTPDGEKPIS